MFPTDQTPLPSLLKARQVHTVSELTNSITLLLESEFPFVAIVGEISNIRRPYSGHLYFTLKDSQAQIRCVLFKNQQRYLATPLEEGAKVVCKGRISVYKQRGEYQIIVDHLAAEGIGNLQQQFDRLKTKLLEEGLFAPELKKKLPAYARKICLITSPSGAAVYDFLKKARERYEHIEIEILPSPMQGDQAAQEIANQITIANSRNWADVIVLARGGGSLEDLAPFNDESLARAIHASTLPIVSAVGHEVDYTIADFVADHRSPTPTAAAQEVVFNHSQFQESLTAIQQRMAAALRTALTKNKNRLSTLEKLLKDPSRVLDNYQLRVDHLTLNITHLFLQKSNAAQKRLEYARHRLREQNPNKQLDVAQTRCHALKNRLTQLMKEKMQLSKEKLAGSASLLDALSPLAVLGRGYALATTDDNQIIHSIKQVQEDDRINVRIDDGVLQSVVKKKLLKK